MTQDTFREPQEEQEQTEQKRVLVEDAALAREERNTPRKTLAEGQMVDADGVEEHKVALVRTICDVTSCARMTPRATEARISASYPHSILRLERTTTGALP